jgi:iron(III) transport system permease protein
MRIESRKIPLLISLLVASLVLLPLAILVVRSFTTGGLASNLGFALSNYCSAYGDPRFLPTLLNSLTYAGGSTVLGLGVAVAIACVATRTNTPFKGLIEIMPLIPLLMPPMTDNIAWIFLLAPRAGILNNFLAETLGIRTTFSAFSLPAMIWVYGLSLVPLMYVIVLPAFATMNPSFEDAARLSGASFLKTLRSVTLPLTLPAILSAGIVGLLQGLRSFETPALQGIPGGVLVFVSLIYEAVESDFNYGLAVAYSTILLITTSVAVWFYVRVTRTREKFAVVSGSGVKPRVSDIGRWRFVALAFVMTYFVVAILLPLVVVFINSIIPTFNYDFFKTFYMHATPDNYLEVFGHPTFVNGLINSFFIALGTAFIVLTCGAVISHIVHVSGVRGRQVFEAIGTIPLGVPGLILSLGLLIAYIGTPVYDSVLGILLAFVIFYLPYGIRIISGALVRVHKEMEEAALVHGASWGQVFTRITLPMLKLALASGFFYIFIAAYREVGAAILLTGPGVNYGAVTLFDYYRSGQWAETAAGSIIYFVLLLIFVMVGKYVFRVKLTI